MKRFKSPKLQEVVLKEAISSGAISKAAEPIIRYLKKKTGTEFFAYPDIEKFSGETSGYGLRLFSTNGKRSVRFNFTGASPDLYSVTGVSVWKGSTQLNVSFEKQTSFVQVLPVVADLFTKGSTKSTVYSTPANVKMDELLEDADIVSLEEDVVESGDMVDGIIDMLAQPGFSKSKVYNAYRSPGYKVINALVAEYSDVITKQVTKYVFDGSESDIQAMKNNKERIMKTAGITAGTVTAVSSPEKIAPDADTVRVEENWERIAFEQQLKDLRNLIRLVLGGASNGLFVAGRGGIGKTWNVEEELKEAGLSDGNGYHSTPAGVSTAGLYNLLFRYQHDLLVFDDSDDVFGSQTSRNLLKNATDTKPKRKLGWTKRSKSHLTDDEIDEEYGSQWKDDSEAGQKTRDEMYNADVAAKIFYFTGKVIFISNLPMDKLDPDGALRTRGFLINIDPTDEEVYDLMEKIAPNMQLEEGLYLSKEERLYVVKLLREGKSAQTANFRKLKRGLNMLAGAHVAGVTISDSELEAMIGRYA